MLQSPPDRLEAEACGNGKILLLLPGIAYTEARGPAQPTAYLCATFGLRIIFTYLGGGKKGQKVMSAH